MIYPEKIQAAVQFTSQKHKNQKREILDYPYITHPLMVFYLVSKFTNNEDVLCAAILHDTIEDTDTSLLEIQDTFGDKVAYLVDILSEDKSLEKKERKKIYYKRMISENNKDIFLIKSADILYNITDFIETFELSGKEKFLTMFSDFDIYFSSMRKRINIFKKLWSENPFLDEINFNLDKFNIIFNENYLPKEISCGIIPVYKNENEEYEFLIVRENAGHWSFPKGHVEEKETFLDTAKRELFEETGLKCTQIDELNIISQKFLNKSRSPITEKSVFYFVGYVDTKKIKIQKEEIQDSYWGTEEKVKEKITHKSSFIVLDSVIKILSN